MPDKRKDSKGRSLRNGETQLPDGKYKFQYIDTSTMMDVGKLYIAGDL